MISTVLLSFGATAMFIAGAVCITVAIWMMGSY